MDFFKKVNALVLGLAVLLAVSCNENAKEKDPEPIVDQTPSQPSQKTCRPIRMVKDKNIYDFSYDSTGKLLAIKKILYPTSGTSGPIELYDSITYKNGLLHQVNHFIMVNYVTRYEAYEYDSKNRLSKITYFQRSYISDPFSQRNASTFTYDAAGNLIERYDTFPNYSTTVPYYKSTYTYLPGNIIKEVRFQIGYSQSNLLSTREWIIDNNRNPFFSIGYLESFNSPLLLTENNIVSWKDTYKKDHTAPLETSVSTISYNTDGYPIKASILENGGAPLEYSYQYNCQ